MIELRHLTKSYLTGSGRHYVFKDLSFRFPEGVSIGLIGRNGAGKSTLMRLLGGIDVPDSGEVVMDGSISWPVGLGGGFQPSLSARDNVKFVCRVHGLSIPEMHQVMTYVENFADIGDFFEQPMKTYSSGMRSRVAFGLSMAFDFDYLLIDEVMAVGDAEFKRKCREAFVEKRNRSRLILVSHNMSEIAQNCDVVVLVEKGSIRVFDDVKAGILAYQGPKKTRTAPRMAIRQTPTSTQTSP